MRVLRMLRVIFLFQGYFKETKISTFKGTSSSKLHDTFLLPTSLHLVLPTYLLPFSSFLINCPPYNNNHDRAIHAFLATFGFLTLKATPPRLVA